MTASLADHQRDEDVLHLGNLAPVQLGMPELCSTGLSENWLWKACGHRHWLALAAAHGLDRPEFRDVDGNRLYPAFTTVALNDARLDAVEEHGTLDFHVSLARTGRSRFTSHMRLYSGAGFIADISIESTFISRTVEGRNGSARRGSVARPCRLLSPAMASPPFRPSTWTSAEGFVREEREELATFVIDPIPDEDFNGVGFLYCAAFQSIFAKAEWAWFRQHSPSLVTRRRRIHYVGNAELGDRLRATLCGSVARADGRASWIELARESDGVLIAVCFADRHHSKFMAGRQQAAS